MLFNVLENIEDYFLLEILMLCVKSVSVKYLV